ncbi:adenosylcobinamide-phosphate synthase CbiB [Bacteroides sp.]
MVGYALIIIFLGGWLFDKLLGDPPRMPHLIVWFGKLIAWGEKRLNKGGYRMMKGAVWAVGLIAGIYVLAFLMMHLLFGWNAYVAIIIGIVCVFYCLAGTTLIKEVKDVFDAVDRSLEEGRKQVARIVGRDTSALNAQQIRTAALETLAENLSDGVIAPMFWFALLGVPGILAYKMVNTLDSMIGYKNERYRRFGCWAAHIDDIANYVPARLTALLMVLVSGCWRAFAVIGRYGRKHASPNSGYPESALAGILDCRFGGPNFYFGELVDKPYIGETARELTTADMKRAVGINLKAEIAMVVLVVVVRLLFFLY